ncbi:MAG TPA: peptidoglycan DD-metalloendopeptidase family protein [Steroidobacteraceae bacterium]|nr:peptidoglycan DD-metalloendopeptidase family protein [Steroidobacteraceae bacterium]
MPCARRAASTGGARLGALSLALVVLLAGCAGRPRPAPPATYVVRAGDTLYSISWRHGLDYRDVARWNGIGADYRIDVGQVLALAPNAHPAAPPAATAAAAARPRSPAPLPVTPAPHWSWPADGTVDGAVEKPSGGVGLRIAGTLGSPVRAAAAGRVVYTGAGLRAYGELVIIKHDDTWLTAYGYNQQLLVHEGEAVREGQPIAAMGTGPGRQAALYFEIRMNGRPVDPRTQLPPR